MLAASQGDQDSDVTKTPGDNDSDWVLLPPASLGEQVKTQASDDPDDGADDDMQQHAPSDPPSPFHGAGPDAADLGALWDDIARFGSRCPKDAQMQKCTNVSAHESSFHGYAHAYMHT